MSTRLLPRPPTRYARVPISGDVIMVKHASWRSSMGASLVISIHAPIVVSLNEDGTDVSNSDGILVIAIGTLRGLSVTVKIEGDSVEIADGIAVGVTISVALGNIAGAATGAGTGPGATVGAGPGTAAGTGSGPVASPSNRTSIPQIIGF